jgi:hypothetical protein
MTEHEAIDCAKLLAKLFPNQLTVETAQQARDEFKKYRIEIVETAIRAHKLLPDLHNGFHNMGRLIEACKIAEQKDHEKTSPTNREGSWCDVRRRQNDYLKDCGDAEVILRVHRGWWFKEGVSKSEGYRRQIESSAKNLLMMVCRLSQADADSWTATIFDENVNYFRQVLEDLRSSQPSFACA